MCCCGEGVHGAERRNSSIPLHRLLGTVYHCYPKVLMMVQVIEEDLLGALVQHLSAAECQLSSPAGVESNASTDRDRQTVQAVLNHTLKYTTHR
jgi:hypothetical protein